MLNTKNLELLVKKKVERELILLSLNAKICHLKILEFAKTNDKIAELVTLCVPVLLSTSSDVDLCRGYTGLNNIMKFVVLVTHPR